MYKEDIGCGNEYRQNYREGIDRLIAKLANTSKKQRLELINNIQKNPDDCRKQLARMFGWPLNCESNESIPEVNKIFVAKNGDVSIYRIQINVLEIPFYGILFVKEDNKRRPLVIVQHGGLGTPELCGNLLEMGTDNYNDIIDRVLKYDVNVFAPQLLLWGQEFSFDEYTANGISYSDAMRRGIDNQLKQFGSSITALEIYGIKRIIDYFEIQSFVDDKKIGMMGLSYGGFYALYTTALEKRIKCCFSCSFFNDRIKYNWTDWVWFNSGNTYTDVEVALLVQPRPLYLCIGDKDDVFDYNTGITTWNSLKTHLCDENHTHFIEFHGTHEFIKDDVHIQEFIHDLIKE